MTMFHRGTSRLRRWAPSTGFYLLAVVTVVLFLFPLVWAAVTSLKLPSEAGASPPTGLPSQLSLANYAKLADYGLGIGQYLGNSLLVGAMTVLFTGVLSILAGFGFAHFSFPGRKWLFLLVLTALMIPYQTVVIALFTILKTLGLYDSLVGLAMVYATFQLPFAIFMMRNTFAAIPPELAEAARVDGCGSVQVLLRIMLPLATPGLITVLLFAFLASWNEFFAALILLSDSANFTLPVMLMNAQAGQFGTVDWGAQQAGVTLTIFPVVVLFIVLQRYYVSGLVAGAVKS